MDKGCLWGNGLLENNIEKLELGVSFYFWPKELLVKSQDYGKTFLLGGGKKGRLWPSCIGKNIS